MRLTVFIGAVLLLCLSTGALHADTPGLHPGVNIYDGVDPLNVGSLATPFVIDWNNDGNKDLLVGDGDGYVWLFLNTNTNADPLFNGGTKVESGGAPIQTENAGG